MDDGGKEDGSRSSGESVAQAEKPSLKTWFQKRFGLKGSETLANPNNLLPVPNKLTPIQQYAASYKDKTEAQSQADAPDKDKQTIDTGRRAFVRASFLAAGAATLGVPAGVSLLKDSWEAGKLEQARMPLRQLAQACATIFTSEFQDQGLIKALNGSIDDARQYQLAHIIVPKDQGASGKQKEWQLSMGPGNGAVFKVRVESESNGEVSGAFVQGNIVLQKEGYQGNPNPNPSRNPDAFLSPEESLRKLFNLPEIIQFRGIANADAIEAYGKNPITGMLVHAARDHGGIVQFIFQMPSYTGPKPLKIAPTTPLSTFEKDFTEA